MVFSHYRAMKDCKSWLSVVMMNWTPTKPHKYRPSSKSHKIVMKPEGVSNIRSNWPPMADLWETSQFLAQWPYLAAMFEVGRVSRVLKSVLVVIHQYSHKLDGGLHNLPLHLKASHLYHQHRDPRLQVIRFEKRLVLLVAIIMHGTIPLDHAGRVINVCAWWRRKWLHS